MDGIDPPVSQGATVPGSKVLKGKIRRYRYVSTDSTDRKARPGRWGNRCGSDKYDKGKPPDFKWLLGSPFQFSSLDS